MSERDRNDGSEPAESRTEPPTEPLTGPLTGPPLTGASTGSSAESSVASPGLDGTDRAADAEEQPEAIPTASSTDDPPEPSEPAEEPVPPPDTAAADTPDRETTDSADSTAADPTTATPPGSEDTPDAARFPDPPAAEEEESRDDEPTAEDAIPEPPDSADTPDPPVTRRRRSAALSLLSRRGISPGGALIGVLSALLGFALVVQLRTTSSTSGLSAARQDDLVRILDDLSAREDRLRQQITSLESTLQNLSTSGDKASVALDEARTRSATLGILTGTAPAQGPGVRLTIKDPAGDLVAEDLLDALEELRAAGGEAFQVGPVRIGVTSAFTDKDGQILADGTALDAPYVVLAIGDPDTLATALNIPGGVVATIRNAGGEALITTEARITINALRELPENDYASPADEPDD